jgi:hypothetical protein
VLWFFEGLFTQACNLTKKNYQPNTPNKKSLLVVDFARFVADPEAVAREVLAFVGADPSLLQFKPLPAGMKTNYQGRRMDPGVRAAFAAHWFGQSNAKLARMLGYKEEDDPLGWRAAVSAKK